MVSLLCSIDYFCFSDSSSYGVHTPCCRFYTEIFFSIALLKRVVLFMVCIVQNKSFRFKFTLYVLCGNVCIDIDNKQRINWKQQQSEDEAKRNLKDERCAIMYVAVIAADAINICVFGYWFVIVKHFQEFTQLRV